MGLLKPIGDWIRVLSLTTAVIAWISGCASSSEGPNRSPVAIAGQDRSAEQGQPILLDSAGSYDPDGDSLTYHWALFSKPEGALQTLQGETSGRSTLSPDVPGSWLVQLTVHDGQESSAPAMVRIQVRPGATIVTPPGQDGDGDGDDGDRPLDSPPQPGRWLYWTADNSLLIERLLLDGSGTRKVVVREEGLVSAGLGVDVAGGKLYWGSVKEEGYVFYRANLDGSDREELFRYNGGGAIAPKDHSVQDVVYDPARKRLYWVLWDFPAILFWTPQPSGITVYNLTPSTIRPRGLALDAQGQRLYFTDSTNGRIYRASTAGQDLTALLSQGAPSPIDIEIDPRDSRLVWTDSSLNKIQASAPADQLSPKDLWNGIPNANRPQGLALDPQGDRIYWCDYTGNAIRSTKRDGKDTQVVVSAERPQDALIIDIP